MLTAETMDVLGSDDAAQELCPLLRLRDAGLLQRHTTEVLTAIDGLGLNSDELLGLGAFELARRLEGVGHVCIARLLEDLRLDRVRINLVSDLLRPPLMGDINRLCAVLKGLEGSVMMRLPERPWLLAQEGRLPFPLVDQLSRRLGGDPADPARRYCAINAAVTALLQARRCNWVLSELVVDYAHQRLVPDIGKSDLEEDLQAMLAVELLVNSDNRQLVSLPDVAAGEAQVRDHLSRLAVSPWRNRPAPALEILTDLGGELEGALELLAETNLLQVDGGPGSGLSAWIRAAQAYLRAAECHRVAVVTSTGRSAARLVVDADVQATTIHRLLGYRGGRSHYSSMVPLPIDALIVADYQAVGMAQLAQLLGAVRVGCPVVFAGDGDQVTSAECGSVAELLRNEAYVPKVQIQEYGKAHNEIPRFGREVAQSRARWQGVYRGVSFIEVSPNTSGLDLFEHVRAATGATHEELREFQWLAPQAEGPLGARSLNGVICSQFFPSAEVMPDFLCCMVAESSPEQGVYRGDIGRIEGQELVFDHGDLPLSLIRDKVEPAQAAVVSRTDGNEFDVVVVVLSSGDWDQGQLYTAAARAREQLIVCGNANSLERAQCGRLS